MSRRSSFFVRVLSIGVLAHLYVGARLIPDAGLTIGQGIVAALCLVVLCALIPQGMLQRAATSSSTHDRLAWMGLLAMGLFSSLFVLTILRDALLLVLWLVSVWLAVPEFATIRQISAWAVPALALLASLVGFYNARRRASVVSVDVPIANLPDSLVGFTIVQISDIHVGPTIKGGYVQAIVDAVNETQPDMIAITGDLVDGSVASLASHTAPLAQLRARRGVYVVTGNHEYYSGANAWIDAFRKLGLHVLVNEHVVFKHGGSTIVVAGVTDYNGGSFDPAHASDPVGAMAGAPDAADFRVLLAHQPRSALAAAGVGYQLQLSGHTHGGQFFPWGFFVRFQQPYTAGLHRHDDMWVYTSRGTGYWGPPMRLGAPSEITRLRLVRA